MNITLDYTEIHILAGRLIYQDVLRAVNDRLSKPDQMIRAIKPFFAVQFSREVVRGIDGYRLKVLVSRLKNSALPGEWYARILAHIKLAWADESIAIPFAFEDWRRLLVRFDFDNAQEFQDWIPLLNHLAAFGIHSPDEFSAWSRFDVTALAASAPTPLLVTKLWQASCIAYSGDSEDYTCLVPEWFANAPLLAQSFRTKNLEDSFVARSHVAATDDLALPDAFAKAGPAARIKLMSANKPDHGALTRFLNTGAQLNTLRQVQCSLRSVAAGVQCWASFCDLYNTAYFPPKTHNVLRWSSFFHPGKTFSLYLAHLGKACQLLNISLSWWTEAVKGVAKGLENAYDASLLFENYIFKQLFRSLIAHETLQSESGRLFYLAYVFILRLPSEALPAVRAPPNALLLNRSRLPFQSALGLRELPNGEQRLVLKLKTRKHVRGGAVLMRPCFCDSDTLASRGICPIHDFWRVILTETASGQQLFPSLIKRNINRILKGTLKTMNVEDAHSYSTHAFRRGASMELKRTDSTLAQVLKTVGWNSGTYRAYLSFVEDEEVNIRLILMNKTGTEVSSDEEDWGESGCSSGHSEDLVESLSSSVSSTSESL